jgi:hypothetical protein
MARALVSEAPCIDLARPEIRQIIGASQIRRGSIQWGGGGVAFTWVPGARTLELRFFAGGVAVAQHINLRALPTRFGGRRFWLVCPRTRALSRALYLPPGQTFWASRSAHGLAYDSQRRRADALTRMVRALDRDDARERRNHIRRLRRRERVT